jgi:hypothetical protein
VKFYQISVIFSQAIYSLTGADGLSLRAVQNTNFGFTNFRASGPASSCKTNTGGVALNAELRALQLHAAATTATASHPVIYFHMTKRYI